MPASDVWRGLGLVLLAASSLGCEPSAPIHHPMDPAAYEGEPSPIPDTNKPYDEVLKEAVAFIAAFQGEAALDLLGDTTLAGFRDPGFWFLEGEKFRHRRDFARARGSYMMALELGSGDPLVHASLALLLRIAATGDDDRKAAVDHYRKAIELDPRNLEFHHDLASTLMSLGNNEEALEVLAVAARLGDDATTEHLLASAHDHAGNQSEALAHADRAIALAPEARKTNLRLDRAWLLSRLGRVDEALQELEQVVAENPGARSIRIELVLEAMEAGKLDVALVHAQGLEAQWPDDPFVLALHAKVLLALGEIDDAILKCEMAKEVAGDLEPDTFLWACK